jgi:hypothetical protein
MRRIGSVSLILLGLACASHSAKPKKTPKPTGDAKSEPKKAAAAKPVAVDYLGPIAAQFEKGQELSASQVSALVGSIEGLSLECGAGCNPVFTAQKVQHRTSKYLAAQLRQDVTSADRSRTAVWLVTFDDKGKRLDARQIEGRESADGRQSGVRTTFGAADRFETRGWSTFDPAKKDPALSEATPERWRISEEGRIVEEVAGK